MRKRPPSSLFIPSIDPAVARTRAADALREWPSWAALALLGTQHGCGTPASANSRNSSFIGQARPLRLSPWPAWRPGADPGLSASFGREGALRSCCLPSLEEARLRADDRKPSRYGIRTGYG